MRLDRLGWTQEEIAEVVGVTQGRIAQISLEMAELQKLIKSVLTSGIPHLEVAERFNLPLQVVWAIDLDGRDDAERMDRLGIKVQPYDVWQFAKCHDLFGSQHPGRIPGELIAHVLYFRRASERRSASRSTSSQSARSSSSVSSCWAAFAHSSETANKSRWHASRSGGIRHPNHLVRGVRRRRWAIRQVFAGWQVAPSVVGGTRTHHQRAASRLCFKLCEPSSRVCRHWAPSQT